MSPGPGIWGQKSDPSREHHRHFTSMVIDQRPENVNQSSRNVIQPVCAANWLVR